MKKRILLWIIVLISTFSILFDGCSLVNKNAVHTKLDDKVIAINGDTLKLTIDDIKKKYADVKIKSIQNIGKEFVLIESQRDTCANIFDVYNLKTGNMDTLPTAPNFVTLEKIENENYFIFLASGKDSESPFVSYPYVIRCVRRKDELNGSGNFVALYEDKYFNLDQSIEAGSKREGVMSDLNVSFSGLEILFKPIKGKEGSFYADATDIPPTKTSYNKDTKQIIFEIETNQLDDKLKENKIIDLERNQYMSSYQINSKENKTCVIITVKDKAKEYTVNKKRLPDGLPYFSVIFKD